MHHLCHKGKTVVLSCSGIWVGKDELLAASLYVCQDFTVKITWQGSDKR